MKNLYLKLLAIIAVVALGLASCASNSDSSSNPVQIPLGNLISKTSCKSGEYSKTETYNKFEDVIEWEFADGTLTLKHINSVFNCCPGNIFGNVKISKNAIEITEGSEKYDCKCNCLYDLTFEIKNLSPGIYKISIPEINKLSTDEAISFSIDLNTNPKGFKIFARRCYPWL